MFSGLPGICNNTEIFALGPASQNLRILWEFNSLTRTNEPLSLTATARLLSNNEVWSVVGSYLYRFPE